jgi:hypothetical protein
MFAEGSLLAQARPNNTTDNVVFTGGELATEVMLIIIANNTAGAIAVRLYHDDAAAGFGIGNALYYDKAVPANDSLIFQAQGQGSGLFVKKGGLIGMRSATANALTVSVYGITAQAAQRVARGVGNV